MSEDYLQREPIAVWNTQQNYWSTQEVDLFSQLSKPFLGRWPTSGMMRNGMVFELPTPEQRTDVTESSLLRTPIADEAGGGPISPAMAKANGSSLRLSGQIIDLVEPDRLPKPAMIPTPRAQDGYERRNMKTMERIANEGGDLTLPTWGATKGAALLPTPTTQDGKNTGGPSQFRRNSNPLNVEVLLIGEDGDSATPNS